MLVGIILLSVTLSIDALFAGFSYGLGATRIPLGSKLIICAFSVAYCALAVSIGNALAGFFPPAAGKITGASILFLLGVVMVAKALVKRKSGKKRRENGGPRTLCRIIIKSLGITIEILKNNPEAGDMDDSGTIDKKEAVLLGFALSVDSLGAGIASALSGLGTWYIPPAAGLCQLAFLSAGLTCGHYLRGKCAGLSGKSGVLASILPGLLLIALSALRLL